MAGGRGDKRKQKQDKRKDKKQKSGGGGKKAPSAARDAAEFERLLDRFAELCVEHDALESFGYPMEKLVPLLVDPTIVPDADTEVQDLLIARLADPAVARELQAVLTRHGEEIMEDLEASEDRRAIVAARSLVDTCVEEGAPTDHPLWDLLLACSITRAFGAGFVLAHLAERTFARRAPSRADLTARFTKALDDAGLTKVLADAGVARPDPARLVTVLLEQVLDSDDLRPALPVEGVLNLLRVQHHLLRRVSDQVHALGPNAALVADLEALVEEAYARDIGVGHGGQSKDAGLSASLRAELEQVLVAHRGEPSDDTEPLVAMLVALAASPPQDDPLLRRVHARTLFAPAIEDEDEEELAIAVWGDAEDDAALEALEKGLAEEPDRAARVARYRKTLAGERTRFGDPATRPSDD